MNKAFTYCLLRKNLRNRRLASSKANQWGSRKEEKMQGKGEIYELDPEEKGWLGKWHKVDLGCKNPVRPTTSGEKTVLGGKLATNFGRLRAIFALLPQCYSIGHTMTGLNWSEKLKFTFIGRCDNLLTQKWLKHTWMHYAGCLNGAEILPYYVFSTSWLCFA